MSLVSKCSNLSFQDRCADGHPEHYNYNPTAFMVEGGADDDNGVHNYAPTAFLEGDGDDDDDDGDYDYAPAA